VSVTSGAPKRTTRWDDAARARERILLDTMAAEPKDSAAYSRARDELVTIHLPLVEHLARRFRDRGEPHDDLVQVGTIGLIKAVDRFDPDRGVEFSTYATPTIVGEIKRHFRDRGWSIRVPRRLQEMRQHISQATAELSQKSGRSPTIAELAQALDLSEEEILEGLESAQAYSTLSIDSSGGGDDDSDPSSLTETLGSEDDALEGVEYRESLKPLLAALSERERQIIMMRFFQNMTQAQIAKEVGVSQMHVSRLLTKALLELRSGLTEDAF
jgi:RNA polymerase sigma-B factor